MSSSLAPPRAPEPVGEGPYVPQPFIVRSRTQETADTATLVLAPYGTGETPSFRAGQFNMVYAFGVGEAAISISGDVTRAGELVHTVQSAGPISKALFSAPPGTVLGVRGPYGSSWPIDVARSRDVVVIAGGLGLPPLRPLIYEILRERDAFGRLEVVYGARTPKHLVFYPELQTWRARSDLRFQVTVDAAGRDWYGDVGVVTTRLPDARFDAERAVAFLCGPEVMLKFAVQALVARGVTTDRIYVSMERNMKCAVGLCGHCQFGPEFVCRDGPVFRFSDIERLFRVREV